MRKMSVLGDARFLGEHRLAEFLEVATYELAACGLRLAVPICLP